MLYERVMTEIVTTCLLNPRVMWQLSWDELQLGKDHSVGVSSVAMSSSRVVPQMSSPPSGVEVSSKLLYSFALDRFHRGFMFVLLIVLAGLGSS
jgi:hypothetical protein